MRLLGCAGVLGWKSILITLYAWRVKKINRETITAMTRDGAKQILEIVKAKYNIEYINPLKFDKNSVYIFMSNHQSLIDIPLIYATLPGTIRPITKSELFRIPIFGRAMRAGECIPVNRHDSSKRQEFINFAKEKMASGISLFFFPEGTRSKGDGNLLPFKSGGFQIARETAAKIIPIGIINTAAVLPAKKFLLTLNQSICLRVGEPIDAGLFKTLESQKELMLQVRNAIQELMVPQKSLI